MGKTPMQHWVQPGRQTRCGPLRRVASARAASTIWMRLSGGMEVAGELAEVVVEVADVVDEDETEGDWGNLHAGDLGVDEDAAVAGGVLDAVVVAIIFAFECGRAAALAGWGLVMVASLVATEVWNWCRHGVPPLGIEWCMIFQTNHLPAIETARY